MATEAKPHLHLEIAHVLFVDIVGYSKLLIDEQKELQQTSMTSIRAPKNSPPRPPRNN